MCSSDLAFAERTFRLAHGIAGVAKLAHPAVRFAAIGFAVALTLFSLALLILAEAALSQLLQQFVKPILEALLILPQIAQLLLALAALTILPLVLSLILALLEGLIAQLLLLADHVAQFVKRRHHVVVVVIALGTGAPHL